MHTGLHHDEEAGGGRMTAAAGAGGNNNPGLRPQQRLVKDRLRRTGQCKGRWNIVRVGAHSFQVSLHSMMISFRFSLSLYIYLIIIIYITLTCLP